MKTLLKTLPLVILLTACGSDADRIRKEIIKKQQEVVKLQEQIAELEKQVADTTQTDKGILVKVTEVKPTGFKHYIEVNGKLDGEENVSVFPKGMGGSVDKIYVKLGQKVSKGQIIASLDAGAMQKQYEQVKSQYDLAVQIYEKQKTLWDQKIGSEVAYLQAKTNKEAAESGLAALEKQLEDTKITSPINGTVEDLPLKIGQTVSPGYPVATVINFSSTKIVAEIAEAYSDRVKTGDSVIVSFPDLNRDVLAIITNASNFINPINRSFKIEINLEGDSKLFKANMIAVLKINDYKAENTVVIPVNLIQTDSKGNYVYLAVRNSEKPVARKAYVEQGASYKGLIEITKGLKPGDKMITVGYLSLNDGTAINF
jgi:membrane fusion protein, multidrug efflux system